MTERTLQEEAAEILVKPPAGGVWLDKDDVELVLRALEEVTAATTGQVVDTQFWRARALEAETRLDGLRALLNGTFPGGPTPHADVPPSVIAPEGTAGDVSPEEEHEVGELSDGNAIIVGQPIKEEVPPTASDSGSGPDHQNGPATHREQSTASADREADVPGSDSGPPASAETGGAPPAKTKCARCGGLTRRWCSDDAPPPFVDFRGKPLCTPCVEALLPRCRGKNLAAGVACTSPAREGKDFCGRHLGQERSPVL